MADNTNGEADSKKQFEEGSVEIQGQKKVTREASTPETGKPAPADIVQQGGGGAVNAATGKP
jgi:hypothetical protein